MPVYRVGASDYKVRLQHRGNAPEMSGGAANTANATFGTNQTPVVLRVRRQMETRFIEVEVEAGAPAVPTPIPRIGPDRRAGN